MIRSQTLIRLLILMARLGFIEAVTVEATIARILAAEAAAGGTALLAGGSAGGTRTSLNKAIRTAATNCAEDRRNCAQDCGGDLSQLVNDLIFEHADPEQERESSQDIEKLLARLAVPKPKRCLPNLTTISWVQKWRLLWTTTTITFRCPCQCLDLGSYRNQYKWDMLPNKDRERWEALGWTEDSWDGRDGTGEPQPHSTSRSWGELTEDQRKTASELGYDQKSWDADE